MQKNSSEQAFSVSLDNFSLLHAEGADAANFLQGQLSCDINTITEAQSSLGCCCDRKGRVLFSFRIFVKAGVYYLYLPTEMAESALAHLRKFIIIAKVNLDIESCQSLGLGGSEIKNTLAQYFSAVTKSFGQCYLKDDGILICVDEKTPRYLFIGKSQEQFSDLAKLGTNDWLYTEIQQGLVNIYPETQGLFIPQMLNYEKFGAISFTKGCYVGQEIVARTQHLGKLKRHLQPGDFDEMVKPGEEVARDEKKGVVAAACVNPEGKYTALMVMQD